MHNQVLEHALEHVEQHTLEQVLGQVLLPCIQETRDKRHIYLLTFCMHRRLGDGGQK